MFARRAAIALAAALVFAGPEVRGAETASAATRQPRVLVLYSNERLLPASIAVDEAIRTTFESELEVPAELYSEFLDVDRFPGQLQQQLKHDYLQDKYRERSSDVIIAAGSSAVGFLMEHRATLFSRVPVVHCGVTPNGLPESIPDDLIVGTPHAVNMTDTLRMALRLQPDTRRVVIVSRPHSNQLRPEDASSFTNRLGFEWSTHGSIAELLGTTKPEHTP